MQSTDATNQETERWKNVNKSRLMTRNEVREELYSQRDYPTNENCEPGEEGRVF